MAAEPFISGPRRRARRRPRRRQQSSGGGQSLLQVSQKLDGVLKQEALQQREGGGLALPRTECCLQHMLAPHSANSTAHAQPGWLFHCPPTGRIGMPPGRPTRRGTGPGGGRQAWQRVQGCPQFRCRHSLCGPQTYLKLHGRSYPADKAVTTQSHLAGRRRRRRAASQRGA